MTTWTLEDRGRTLAVSDDAPGLVVVTVDGHEVAQREAGAWDSVTVDLGEIDTVPQRVRVELGLGRRIRKAALAEGDAGPPRRTSFVPPPGSRARRLHDLREGHPRVFAARHVATTLIGFLGISALIGAFFAQLWARIDWSWLPDVTLPQLTVPDWLAYLNPFYWLRQLLSWIGSLLPDWDLFGWWPDWELPWLRYVVPVAVAVAIASREVKHRQDRARREASYRVDASAEQAPEDRLVEPQEGSTDAHG